MLEASDYRHYDQVLVLEARTSVESVTRGSERER